MTSGNLDVSDGSLTKAALGAVIRSSRAAEDYCHLKGKEGSRSMAQAGPGMIEKVVLVKTLNPESFESIGGATSVLAMHCAHLPPVQGIASAKPRPALHASPPPLNRLRAGTQVVVVA